MFRNYIKIAWRTIWRNRVYSTINVLGLSLGICACIVIFLITRFEFSFDKFHPDRSRIFRIVGETQDASGEKNFLNNIIPDVAGFQNQIPGFETVAAFHNYGGSITIPDSNQSKKFENKIEGSFSSTAIITWPSYFSIFQYIWLAGNPASLNEPFRVVLTQKRAKKYFGNSSPQEMIGKTVIYDDSLRVTVSGIVKDWEGNSDFKFTDFISISTATHSFLKDDIPTEDWSSLRPHNGSAFVKLSTGVTPEQINRRLAAYIKSHVKTGNGIINMYLQPLNAIHFTTEYRRGDDGDDFNKAYLPTLYILMSIALFILIIAAVNFINLSTAQSIQRVKEIGVRKVMGSNKRNILFQFLIETFVLTLFAMILSTLLVDPMLYIFKDFIPLQISFHFFEPSTGLFLFVITITTTLLAGFYPAKILSSYLPALSLKGISFQKQTVKFNFRKALIVFQFTLSLIFIIGIITISKQINFMMNADKGFNSDAIITLTNRGAREGEMKVLAGKIKNISGVSKVLMEMNAPMGFAQMSTGYKFKGKEEISLHPTVEIGNEDYIPFYNMKLVAGRNLFHSDSVNELIVNETLSRLLGYENPRDVIGKMLSDHPIVGVVADFHQGSFHEAILPALIHNVPDNQKSSLAIKLTTDSKNLKDVKATLSTIESEWKKLFPDTPFNYSFLNESITRLYGQEEKMAWLTKVAAIITIFISCMGLFGLGMFTAQRRTKEIGIRKVLGATVLDITAMVGKDFLKLVFISFLIASPVAYYFSHQWLQDFVYRTNISWWVFALAAALALLITALTISFQAIKAANGNPVKSLRTE